MLSATGRCCKVVMSWHLGEARTLRSGSGGGMCDDCAGAAVLGLLAVTGRSGFGAQGALDPQRHGPGKSGAGTARYAA